MPQRLWIFVPIIKTIAAFAFSLNLAAFALASDAPHSRCGGHFSGLNQIATQIAQTDELKGSFESLMPIQIGSIGALFPEAARATFDLFMKRPSYLHALNRGRAPLENTPMSLLYQRIRSFAVENGNRLHVIAKMIPESHPARAILKSYADQFQKAESQRSDEIFDDRTKTHTAALKNYGKRVVDSVWAELRVALRAGNLSRVNVTVRQLVEQGFVKDPSGLLRPFWKQELDHIYFRTAAGSAQENSLPTLIIGETKVKDTVFHDRHVSRRDTYEQLARLQHIATILGKLTGLPVEIQYAFIAGITSRQIDALHANTNDFNRSAVENGLAPVDLKVFGDYSLLR